jgi:hypothetical protein
MRDTTIEISVQGKWTQVPALEVGGKDVIVRGKWLKVAMVNAEEWLETEVEDPGLCVRMLREQAPRALRADLFTFAQKPPHVNPRYSYPLSFDSVAVVRTTCFKDWWEGLPQESRKNVRRAQKKGVVVTVRELSDDLIKGIVELNNDSPLRQGKRYAHFGKTADQVKKDQSTYLDRSDFICAYHEDELIGFVKLVYRGDVASILQILPKASHNDKRPANAMVAKAVEVCEARGVSYLTYGQFNYGNKGASPLREFKERNGFEERLIPRYHVPLTVKGQVCLAANLHRGALGIVPTRVITFGVALRAKWYNLKKSTSRCSLIVEQPNRTRQVECSNPPAGSNT